MDNYLGEIRMFIGPYAPEDWLFCNGQLLPTSGDYSPLFTLLGTMYGGDGVANFALPDLRGRVPVHAGKGDLLPAIALAEAEGTEVNYAVEPYLPPHSHLVNATNQLGNTNLPTDAIFANTRPQVGIDNEYGIDLAINGSMNIGAIGYTGESDPINNVQPFFTVSFIIAAKGIFPVPPPKPPINE